MKLYVIVATLPGAETPWVVGAWDEWSVDENRSGYEADLKKAQKDHGGENVRVGIVHVSDSFLFTLFSPVETKATKEEKA